MTLVPGIQEQLCEYVPKGSSGVQHQLKLNPRFQGNQ
jgi:hypothetical protein